MGRQVFIWLGAFVLAFAVFYALDIFIMGIQGLPLNWDLTPAR